MKKLFVLFTFATVLTIAGWEVYQDSRNESALSDIAEENLDALATYDTCRWRDTGTYEDCSNGDGLACPCGG
ncbi:NVEALA domain-containing protein [Parabacteroides sp.]